MTLIRSSKVLLNAEIPLPLASAHQASLGGCSCRAEVAMPVERLEGLVPQTWLTVCSKQSESLSCPFQQTGVSANGTILPNVSEKILTSSFN